MSRIENLTLPIESRVFNFGIRGRRVRVESNNDESISYLQGTFFPDGAFGMFQVATADDAQPNIVLQDRVLEANQLGELWAEFSQKSVLDEFEITRGLFQPKLSAGDCSIFLLEGSAGAPCQLLVRQKNQMTLLGVPRRDRKRWLVRMLRDIASHYAFDDGSLAMHASAFTYNGLAYLAVGDSGAGKTTLAVAFPRIFGSGAWIGNDRIHLDPGSNGYDVCACPLSLATNKGTLLALHLNDYEDWDLHSTVPDSNSDWGDYNGEEKLKVSPAEVEQYFGVEVSAHAPLGGVILPSFDATGMPSVKVADRTMAKEVLQRNCLSIDDNMYGEDWLGLRTKSSVPFEVFGKFLTYLDKLPVLTCTTTRPEDLQSVVTGLVDLLQIQRPLS